MKIKIQSFTNAAYKVPPSVVNRLPRGKMFTPYVVAQEGHSSPKFISSRPIKLNWPANLIKSIANKFVGAKFFVGHGKGTNSHDGRSAISRAYAAYNDKINGRESVVVLAEGDLPFDICSMEATISHDIDGNVLTMDSVSGIAVEYLKNAAPAFSGAVRLQQVQCTKGARMKNITNAVIQCEAVVNEDALQLSFNELRQAVTRRGMQPFEIFTPDQIIADERIIGPIKERLQRDVVDKKTFDELKTKYEAAFSELAEYQKKERNNEMVSMIEKTLSTQRYTDQQKEVFKLWMAEGFFDNIDPTDPQAIKEILAKAESRYQDYKKINLVKDDGKITEEEDSNFEEVDKIAEEMGL